MRFFIWFSFGNFFLQGQELRKRFLGPHPWLKINMTKENGYIFFYANEIKSQNTMLINVQRIKNIKMFFFNSKATHLRNITRSRVPKNTPLGCMASFYKII